ncbi:phytanoyl-CoA dioxygenase family protein [Chloroflexi bacterium TSY]|nr:phytanoyl-CoA dioxygenase family protein [Chloroflexi bacterium TSY]
MIPSESIEQFRQDGYVVARGLFSHAETEHYIDHFMAMCIADRYPGDYVGVQRENDPQEEYPRMFNMHHRDEKTLRWLTDERICRWLTGLLGQEPYASQTMLYFKPPGCRGQALHQDQYYLRIKPGTCMAAWMALDPCEEINGCMHVVPGSQDWPLLCPFDADTNESFTDIVVPLPPGKKATPVKMEPGDVLFFNGQLVHGSFPNMTTDRFRRALVGHYVEGIATEVAWIDHPVFRMDGTPLDEFGVSEAGGECGVWIDRDGEHLVELKEQYNLGPIPQSFKGSSSEVMSREVIRI